MIKITRDTKNVTGDCEMFGSAFEITSDALSIVNILNQALLQMGQRTEDGSVYSDIYLKFLDEHLDAIRNGTAEDLSMISIVR